MIQTTVSLVASALLLGALPAHAQSLAVPSATSLSSQPTAASPTTRVSPRQSTRFLQSSLAGNGVGMMVDTQLKPQSILNSAISAVNAAVAIQSGSNAREIESKRTMGLVKIIIGSICAIGGVSYMAAGGQVATIDGGGGIGATAMVIGAGLGGGGAWLIYDGVQDRGEAAEMSAASSLNFAPTRGGGAVIFSRGW